MASSSTQSMLTPSLVARQAQNTTVAKYLEHHWGYGDRIMPCTKDAAHCTYLENYYHSHDLGVRYIGILWAAIIGLLFVWGVSRRIFMISTAPSLTVSPQISGKILQDDAEKAYTGTGAKQSATPRRDVRLARSAASGARRRLLPDFLPSIFGHTTRLQVLVLLVLVTYLIIVSFTGLVYAKYITPATNGKHSTRTTLGAWSDRLGALAFGLMPLTVLLASRESILSLVTGVPYTSFNFLHRWLGYVIFAQSMLHAIGWTIVEARLYQPQPSVGRKWIAETYMRYGLTALSFLVLLFVFSLPFVIRRTGYEFFRKVHYVLAMLFIGTCWGHWDALKVFLLPSLLFWGVDRGLRLIRSFLLHCDIISPTSSGVAFRPAQAKMQVFNDASFGEVVRLDFDHQQRPWHVGQHFYLCFSELSIWQSHPFTPASHPSLDVQGRVRHTYIFRARGGETRKVAQLAKSRIAEAIEGTAGNAQTPSTGVILSGPYGSANNHSLERNPDMNVVCVAGGTGIAYVLPILKHAMLLRRGNNVTDAARIELIWIVKRASDVAWIAEEMQEMQSSNMITVNIVTTREEKEQRATLQPDIVGSITSPVVTEDITTPESGSDAASDSESMHKVTSEADKDNDKEVHTHRGAGTGKGRPDLASLLSSALNEMTDGPTTVYASGPSSMLSDLRSVVARHNSGIATWKGIGGNDVRLVCDDRMEWV